MSRIARYFQYPSGERHQNRDPYQKLAEHSGRVRIRLGRSPEYKTLKSQVIKFTSGGSPPAVDPEVNK
jgi:hypothetical protein